MCLLPYGTLELGVHNADVTFFLSLGGARDAAAASRQAVPSLLMGQGPGLGGWVCMLLTWRANDG